MPLSGLRLMKGARGFLSLNLLAFLSVAFVGALFLVYYLSGSGVRTSIFQAVDSESVFPEAFPLNSPVLFYTLPHHNALNPVSGKDFLITAWLSYRRLPADGERQILLSKFDGESDSRRGYAIALEGGTGYVRPLVYWRNPHSEGGWYEFADFTVSTEDWFLLAVSFREDRFLGVHKYTISKDHDSKVTLLGGYDLLEIGLPDNVSELKLGSDRTNMRIDIGSLGIFSVKNLSEKLRRLLDEFALNPFAIPAVLRDDGTTLWITDGEADKSQYSHDLENSRTKSRRRRGEVNTGKQ